MVVYTTAEDTKLRYKKTAQGKRYELPAGFKAFVLIDSGRISNLSLLETCLSEAHEQIRYQIVGADTELASVYISEQPKLSLNVGVAECETILNWFDSIAINQVLIDLQIQIAHPREQTGVETATFKTVADALRKFDCNAILTIKSNGCTVVTLASYISNGVERLNLTTSLHTCNRIVRPVLEFFNRQFT